MRNQKKVIQYRNADNTQHIQYIPTRNEPIVRRNYDPLMFNGGSDYAIAGSDYPIAGTLKARSRDINYIPDMKHRGASLDDNDIEGGAFWDDLVDTFGTVTGTKFITDPLKNLLATGVESTLEDRVTRLEQILCIVPNQRKTTKQRKTKAGEIANRRLLGKDDISKPPPRQQRLTANSIF